jgi:hypothetical protein
MDCRAEASKATPFFERRHCAAMTEPVNDGGYWMLRV